MLLLLNGRLKDFYWHYFEVMIQRFNSLISTQSGNSLTQEYDFENNPQQWP